MTRNDFYKYAKKYGFAILAALPFLVLTGVLLVKDSAERGGNFEYEVEVLSNIAADNPQMAKEVQNLVPFAKEGISSELELVKDFDVVYANLLDQQKTDFDKTWKERLNTKLSEIVQIKKTNENAPEFSADKNLENIKKYVDAGELSKAASLLMMPKNQEWMQNEALQQWVKKVQAREEFYDLIEDVRETRKKLMMKIIPSYEGEVWCISKHLLASSMRLMEVGTKQQSLGNKEQAYDLFNKAYDLYCLFWGLNMNMLDVNNVKWIEDSVEDIKKISKKIDAAGVAASSPIEEPATAVAESVADEEPKTAFAKMKAFVRKAVDCCIE